MGQTVRVAATQLAVVADPEENLATCRRVIDAAAEQGAELIVLPEFCNHPAWYDDQDAARAAAVRPGDDWLAGIADRAAAHDAWVMVNATRLADDDRVFGSNFLFSPDGSLAAVSDKQVLMGGESLFLAVADDVAPIVEAPFGPIGLYSCMDGVINETPRALSLRGARVLCNSLNSFALDEASLHIPVRAAENRVFVVASNKVGPLLGPEATVEVAAKLHLDPSDLVGAGEAQVVAPDGAVLAMAPKEGEAVVVADIDPDRARDKHRPDGTDRFEVRRPELYAPLADPPAGRTRPAAAPVVTVAVVQPEGPETGPVLAQVAELAQQCALIVLPELVTEADGLVDNLHEAAERGALFVDRLAKCLRGTTAVVVTSVVEFGEQGAAHVGIMVDEDGVIERAPQMHRWARHSWVGTLGTRPGIEDLPWGRVAIVTGDDATLPEAVRLAALAEADVIAVPFQAQEGWETATGLVERSAENRVCLVAATRASEVGTSVICTLERDFTLWTPWLEREFDGRISHPLVTRAPDVPGVTSARIHPVAAANRVLTRETDVVDSRPWKLLGAITGRPGVSADGGAS